MSAPTLGDITTRLPHERSREEEPGPPTPAGSLALTVELREELATKAVRYCHFKSNDMLLKSMDGRNDLDLLVHRGDAQRFLAVLARLGFKRALAPAGRDHPGVAHYYGLDIDSGLLVHVHAHFQLVVGDDATKNYRLPIEEAYVESSQHGHALPIPAPEFELAVFVVRMMLKHGTWDAVVLGNGDLGEGERRELQWLRAQVDVERCRAVVAQHLAGIGIDLWSRCLAALESGSRGARIRLGRELMRAMRAHGRRSRSRDTAVRVLRRLQWAWTWYALRRPARKRLERTGVTIAVVGGDGAGKSTAVESLTTWLGGTFVVHRTHLGRPRPSLTTLVGKGAIAVGRRVTGGRGTSYAVDPRTAGPEDFPSVSGALWHVLTARDRLRDYRRLRRVADAGGIVISDRWPLPQLHLMDGSRVGWVLDQQPTPSSRLVCRLARIERRLYADIAAPDVLVVLRIDPEVAVLRRPEDAPDYVRSRNGEVYETDWRVSKAVVIDADQTPESVLALMRNVIWKRL